MLIFFLFLNKKKKYKEIKYINIRLNLEGIALNKRESKQKLNAKSIKKLGLTF